MVQPERLDQPLGVEVAETDADAVGIHYQTVGYLERGEYSPSLPMALKIVAYFDLPLESVFSLSPFPKVGEGR